MPNAHIPVPPPWGGVSRQPSTDRHENQVEDSTNALFDVAYGFSKRPGSVYVGSVSSLTAGAAYRLHPIERDQNERFLVVYGTGVLKVYDLEGREQTVTISDDAQSYLDVDGTGVNGGASADSLVMATSADHTIIGNRNVAPRAESSPRFDVTSTQNDYEALIATTPTSGTYHRTKNPSGGQPAGYWLYNAGESMPAKWYGRIVSGYWDNPDTYDAAARNPGKFNIVFRKPDAFAITDGNWTEGTLTLTSTGAFADYVFASGDVIYIAGGTGVTAGLYTIASRVDDDNITLTSSLSTGSIDLANSDIETGVYDLSCDVEVNVSPATFSTMNDVAAEFQTSLQTFDSNILCAWQVETPTTGRFVITGPYNGAGATITGPQLTSGQIAGSDTAYKWAQKDPFRAGGTSFITDGMGDPAAKTLDVVDRWTRVPAPGQSKAVPTPTTMPVKLVRLTKAFVDEDGAYNPSQWQCDTIEWTARLSGNEVSNPPPSIFSEDVPGGISDIAFHRSRLAISRDESVVFSQSSDFFNLFIDDVTALADSDPIDIQCSSNTIAIIDHMVGFRKTLILFSKAARQFELSSPDLLTPDSASVTPSTSYHSIEGVRPAVFADLVYFPSGSGSDGVIYEYFFDDSSAGNIAADITRHVRGYVPPSIRSLVTSPNNNTLVAVVSGSNSIYVYRSHWSGSQKIQSAWTRYSFNEADTVVDAAVIRDDAYLLIEIASGFILEKLAIPHEDAPYGAGTWFGAKLPLAVYTDYTPISDGSFSITIDGATSDVTGCDFTSATSMDDVADVIQTQLQVAFTSLPTCRFTSNRFIIESGTTGVNSAVSQPDTHSSMTGTDLSTAAIMGTPGTAYESQMPYRPLVDRQIELTGTYDANVNETTWDYTLDDPTLNVVVLGRGFGSQSGNWITPTRVNNTTVKTNGRFDLGTVTVGRSYEMDVTLSRPHVRQRDGTAFIDGEMTLSQLAANHQQTGYYQVIVSTSGTLDRIVTFEPDRVGVAITGERQIEDEGKVTAMVMSRAQDATVRIVNDSPTPSVITNLEWVGNFDRRTP